VAEAALASDYRLHAIHNDAGRASSPLPQRSVRGHGPSAAKQINVCECGPCPQAGENVAGHSEGRCRLLCSAKRHQATPLAEQRLGLLVGEAEVIPVGSGGSEAGYGSLVFLSSLFQ
jgi:hypothetical protein